MVGRLGLSGPVSAGLAQSRTGRSTGGPMSELDELDFAALSAFLAWWFGTAGVDWIRREDG